MIQVYASRTSIAQSLWVDPRSIAKMICDKKIIQVVIKDKIRYIVTKDIFIYLSQ